MGRDEGQLELMPGVQPARLHEGERNSQVEEIRYGLEIRAPGVRAPGVLIKQSCLGPTLSH